jgi:hypothetical protein
MWKFGNLVVGVSLLLLGLGCNKGLDRQLAEGAKSNLAATSAQPPADLPITPPPAQPELFTFRGVHSGMTAAEVKVATVRYRVDGMQCVNHLGGPNHNIPAVECAFTTDDQSSVNLFFYRGKLFHISWGCAVDECAKATRSLKAHFSKPQSDREETVRAQVGAFRERVGTWRSSEETAKVAGGVHFEVLNYKFAPSFVKKQ